MEDMLDEVLEGPPAIERATKELCGRLQKGAGAGPEQVCGHLQTGAAIWAVFAGSGRYDKARVV